jgi:hypothetical protein
MHGYDQLPRIPDNPGVQSEWKAYQALHARRNRLHRVLHRAQGHLVCNPHRSAGGSKDSTLLSRYTLQKSALGKIPRSLGPDARLTAAARSKTNMILPTANG